MVYLSRNSSLVLPFTEPASAEETGCMFRGSSREGGLSINDESNGSGSMLEEETKHEDPPRSDCKLPSRSSFLNSENAELDPPLRNLLFRCTLSSVKEHHTPI